MYLICVVLNPFSVISSHISSSIDVYLLHLTHGFIIDRDGIISFTCWYGRGGGSM